MAITNFVGFFNALDYAYGTAGSAAPPLQAVAGSTSSGTYTLTCFPQTIYTSAGKAIPISAVCPINVGGDSGMDINITPSAVANNNLNQVNITGTFTYAHGPGAQVSSATFGLQEALLAAHNYGGGVVVVDAKWFAAGGTQAIINASTQYADVTIQDNSGTSTAASNVQSTTIVLTAAQVNGMYATPVELLPTPDSGSFYVIQNAMFVNKNGGTAWTAGGAIEVGYGATVATEALTGTVAATFLTSPTVTELISVLGISPLASATASTYLGKPIYITNATQAFATGTGTLEINLLYQKFST